VGYIEERAAAMNSADGVVTFAGRDSATFETADGFSVALARHLGPKVLPPCM
jgi:hypothetical protein